MQPSLEQNQSGASAMLLMQNKDDLEGESREHNDRNITKQEGGEPDKPVWFVY